MDVSNSGKLKMESKKAMFCVSHCRGHHSARPQNGTDALTFLLMSFLLSRSFHSIIFFSCSHNYYSVDIAVGSSTYLRFTQPDFVIQSHGRPASALVTCFSYSCDLRQAIFVGKFVDFDVSQRSYRLLRKRSFLAACCYELITEEVSQLVATTFEVASQLNDSLKLFQSFFHALSNNAKFVHWSAHEFDFATSLSCTIVDFRFPLSLSLSNVYLRTFGGSFGGSFGGVRIYLGG